MNYKIAVIKGDGIGPEVVTQAQKVLTKIGEVYGHSFHFTDLLMGGIAYDTTGNPLPKETVDICKQSDAVLLGAVGGPKWDNLPAQSRPETGLLSIRKALNLYANIRPAVLFPALKEASPLKDDLVKDGINIYVVRELTGGIYFGERGKTDNTAYDTECYSTEEIRRIAHVAFMAAQKRKKHVTSIDKANVLESSRLWREVVHEVAKEYPDVTISDMLVDNAAMQLVKNPRQFDVVLANNMFGDILSDEAAQITGSIGILPSSSRGDGTFGLYEPIHGSAPDIAGKDLANPIATILSVAMMLRDSFSLEQEAKAVEDAVDTVLNQGLRTADLGGQSPITCSEMGDAIVNAIQ
ncbi:MAG: 3-isopropylmalate dehydrogenase [Ruminococcaceae bacterium]|nr:3-isopropylmalate dehydrogenase [Oscillospiraceae bacterium]